LAHTNWHSDMVGKNTQTWWERRLIGYAINTDQEKTFNGPQTFSLIWKIDEPLLYDHLDVELI
jgi:hypothetical protein